jgi:Domain of unknown function (DUF4388)
MAVEGTLELFKLPEILQLVSQQRKTGILTVQGQQDIIAISFLDGKIVGADALNQTVEEGLSQVLVREGLMSAADFNRAVAEQQSAGSRLVDFLVDQRYVAREHLLRALRIQTAGLLEKLLSWDKGEFKFYGGDEVPYEDGFVPIPVEELLFQAAQKAASQPAAPRPVAVPPPAPPAERPAPQAPAAPAETSAPAQARPGLRVVRKEGIPAGGPVAARVVPGAAPATEGEVAGPFRKMRVEAPAAGPVPRPVLPSLLAAGLAGLVVAALLTRPEALIFPFPWQTGERGALAQDQRSSLYLKIDRAAKTWFLLEGHFPTSLAELQQAGFLSRSDLRDPQGHPLRYTAAEESYTLQPVQGGSPVPGAETSEAISGNFLLDPEFLTLPTDSTAPPLVLLD